MKILDKIGLVLFSVIILVVSLLAGIAIAGWLELNLIIDAIEIGVTHEIISKVVLGVSVVFVLLALKCIFFNLGGIHK